MIMEQVKLIHKELNRRNNGRSKQLYNTLTKFPISSQIQAAAVCFMFNLPEIEQSKTPLRLSVQKDGEKISVSATDAEANLVVVPNTKDSLGSLFLEKYRKAREEENMTSLLRPHLESKLSHFPGDAPTVIQVAPVTNNFSNAETSRFKDIVESMTRMALVH